MGALGESLGSSDTDAILAEILSSTADTIGAPLPTGTATLLLADVEGSVKLWESEPEAMGAAVVRLDELASELSRRHRGARPVEQGEGDSFVLAFARASDALHCALGLQRAIAGEPWPGELEVRVRVALHTGDVELRDEGNYAGATVNRCARLRGLAHGGQTLLSQATHDVVADRLPEGVTLKDLGQHRLRDLARPERAFQLCDPELGLDFPPLRSLDALPNNLPLQLTTFIGREAEIAEARRLLAEARMLTLTGAGGCGKTRLSLQLGAELVENYPDGVWWADLAPVSDPELVASAVAALVGVQEVHGERLLETLVGRLRERHLLLGLDNCEHLVSACAELASEVLRLCPSVAILATSREPLGVEGEISLRVPSLDFPEADPGEIEALARFDSVELFLDRARRVRPNFELTRENATAIAEICRRLDGIPLAIELAAARTRVLSPAQIAEGLFDRFRLLTGGARTALPRQRTLEASLDWSYGLLSDPERTLLARLSVFAGGFGLDAAEDVASGEGIDRYRVLDLLSALVARSLVQVEETDGEARYRLLETMRNYARQRLAEAGDADAVRTRHLAYYVMLAERAEAELEGPGFGEWLFRLGGELGNLRVAMDWASESGQSEEGLRIVGATTILWWLSRMHFGEAERRFGAALAAAEGVDPAIQGKALVSSTAVQFLLDFRGARESAEEAVALAREAGDPKLLGVALYMRAYAEFLLGLGSPRADLGESLRIARELDDRPQVLWCLMTLAMLESLSGAPSDGRRNLEQALKLSRRWGRVREASWALVYLGLFVELPAGNLRQAEGVQKEALAGGRAIADRVAIAMALAGLSHVAVLQGDCERGQALADEAVEAARESGARVPEAQALLASGRAAYARGDAPAAQSALERALEVAEAVGVKLLVAHTLAALGALSVEAGDVATGREQVERGRADAEGLPWPLSVVLLAGTKLARLEGEEARAEDVAHEMLRAAATSENLVGIVDALEALAPLAAGQESFREAARLFGAAERLRDEIGYARLPVTQPNWEADVGAVRSGLDGDGFATVWEEGRALTTEEAIAYAQRGRGERKRPAGGWGSLTPAELEVVRLIAQGLRNAEIANRLFVTRNTVKSHLAHIYTKLDVSSRAELAAEATRRDIARTPTGRITHSGDVPRSSRGEHGVMREDGGSRGLRA